MKENIHYLKPVGPYPPLKTRNTEERLQELAKQVSKLEKEVYGQLKKIEKLIESKKNQESFSKQGLQGELRALIGRVDEQFHDIAQELKKTAKTPSLPAEPLLQPLKEKLKKIRFFKKVAPSVNKPVEQEEEFDPFGRDPAFEMKLKPFFDFLYYRYWRVTTHGIENIPAKGRALLVANHSGTLPYDGSMIRLAVTNDHPAGRDVRFLVEDFVYYLPFVGTLMYRIGGVRASPENAERLLQQNNLVAVFPEGVKGIGKSYSQRYHLQRFGRGGFIKLALRTSSPIIPVAVIGAEEIHPMLFKSSFLAKPLGIPYIPITPTFPLLGPLGLIPLPTKWSIYFGKPIDLSKYGKGILDDELEIHKLSEKVRQTIQGMVTEALKQRQSVWRG